ncbi:MAG: acyl-CoA dehydrogenase family protein [Firmicutes bacterium]|nr:acyl-CoA dehydrogenase family protein [Bacillota bacterium]
MDTRLPDAVREAQARMRKFVEEELVPLEPSLPPFANVLPKEDASRLVQRMRAEGLWALAVPRRFGGGGLGLVGLCALREALGHTTLWSLAPLLGSEPPILLYQANEAQQKEFLLPTLRGERYGCFALTEPGAGSDAASLSLRAEPDGEGHYVLNGTKIFISYADEADYALVFGRVPAQGGSPGGITLFLVDLDTPGVRVVRQIPTMGGARPSEIVFEDCRVPESRIVGEVGKAFELAQHWFDCDRIALQPPIALGAAARCLSLAQRHGVASSVDIAQWALQLDAAREMLYHAAWRADQDLEVRHEAAMCKTLATTTALAAIDQVMQWFGARGYSRELPMERYYRDLRRFTIAAGTVEIQQFIVARGLIRGYTGLGYEEVR